MRAVRLTLAPAAVAVAAVMLAMAPVAVVTPLISMRPDPVTAVSATFVLLLMVFALWPWAILPVGIIGGALAGAAAGGDVRTTVLLHVLPLAAGGIALAIRLLLRDAPRPMPADGRRLMAVVAASVVCGAAYGLVLGNRPGDIVVAVYEVGVIPAYYFIGLHTLGRPRWFRNAALLFVVTITALTAIQLASPGRHGGLLSLIALAPVVVVTGRFRGLRRIALACVGAVLTIDVVLSAFRSVWIAAGVVAVLMAVRGDASVRRGLAATGVVTAVLFGLFVLQGGIAGRAEAVAASLERDAGYRVAEAVIGLDVFSSWPIFGAGMGQSTLNVSLAGFGITDVGPVYHAFYVLLLANLGLAGLCVVLGPVLWLARVGFAPVSRGGLPLAFAALTVGFVAAALVAAPTDGHWELGLLPALAVVTHLNSSHPLLEVNR